MAHCFYSENVLAPKNQDKISRAVIQDMVRMEETKAIIVHCRRVHARPSSKSYTQEELN